MSSYTILPPTMRAKPHLLQIAESSLATQTVITRLGTQSPRHPFPDHRRPGHPAAGLQAAPSAAAPRPIRPRPARALAARWAADAQARHQKLAMSTAITSRSNLLGR